MSQTSILVVASPAIDAASARRAFTSIDKKLITSGVISTQDSTLSAPSEFQNQLKALANHPAELILILFQPAVFLSKALRAIVAGEVVQDSDVAYFDDADCARPEFSPERLRGQDYTGAVLSVRSRWLSEWLVDDCEFAELFKLQLLLAANRQGAKIEHLPLKLVEMQNSGCAVSSTDVKRALQELVQRHLDLTGGGGEVLRIESLQLYPSRRALVGEPLVSIVIPSQASWSGEGINRKSFLIRAIQSILAKSTYTNIEVILVVDSGADPDILAEIRTMLGELLTLVWWEHPFNFSQKMNLGAVHARGEYLLLLNDDVEVISPEWIEALVSLAQRPNAGMVGSMLYFEDNTIQHGGHAYVKGQPTHIALGLARGSSGFLDGLLVEREVSGVTAACALLSRDIFFTAGGFTALLPGNYNDLDLCMKIARLGFDIYWTPFAELYHFESKTRDAQVHDWEFDIIRHRWGNRLDDSRFWPAEPSALG